MPEVDAWRAMLDEVDAGRPCALLAVVASRGSSPGRRGALMAVGRDGELAGTIGGGQAQAGLVQAVTDRLRAGELVAHTVVLEHREDAEGSSGMICGGSQTVVVSPLGAQQRADLATVVDALEAGLRVDWGVGPQGWRAAPVAGEDWFHRLESGPSHWVYVIGAGHVGQALSGLLVGLDFRVVLIDERAGLLESGVGSGHERITTPYEELASIVKPGPDHFAAIMTHSHQRDAAALLALRGVELGYLGLLGSRAKVHRLVADRPMPSWFHAPMGIPIGSTNPAEIAVSIAAEMVAVRNGASS